MVTVIQRPVGFKIIDQAISAVITNGLGDALVTFTAHALFTGAYVYISSDIDEYNGFWYVTVINDDSFKLSPNASSAFVEYYQDADISYYQTSSHLWSSIFLPIVYKATNNRWPINTVDDIVNITSHEDDNGYTRVYVDDDPGVVELMYLKVTDHGVYQTVDWGPGWVTISKAYDASDSFTTAQKYYNNYQVRVNIYAGLNSDHPWQAKKPYTLVGELSLTPDSDGEVMFSVSDYLKSKVAIKNNPTLFSMPLNLDAFTGFYISTAESYDGSDSYSVFTSLSEFTDDTIEFFAIAGQLPFKNIYGGMYSDYVYTSGNPAAWLTTLSTLIGVVGKYFDISFIKNVEGDLQILIDKLANGYVYETQTIDYTDQGIGVYRIPLDFSSQYDQFCVRAALAGIPPGGGFTILPSVMNPMNNSCGGTWTLTNPPVITLTPGANSGYITYPFAATPGTQYDFSYEVTISSGGSVVAAIRIAILDDLCNVVAQDNKVYGTSGLKSESVSLTPSGSGTKIGIRVVNTALIGNRSFELSALSYDGTPGSDPVVITQELCIDIYEECVNEAGEIVLTSRRLLEDTGYRLTEGDDYRALET